MVSLTIISGGQTGVDRAALDVGLHLKIPVGGACPRGRRAEDGPIDKKYPLEELQSEDYETRTCKNVEDADGTLILAVDNITGGTALTKEFADQCNKPCLVLDLNQYPSPDLVWKWIKLNRISILNVAGPRESSYPGIYLLAYDFLLKTLCQFISPF